MKKHSFVKVTTRIFPFADRVMNFEPTDLPQTLEMHLSDICNLSCKFCYYHSEKPEKTHVDFLPTNRVMATLDCFQGTEDKALVLSGGGEPTLHPHFSEIVDKAVDVGLDVGVITNGVHYSKKIEDALLKTKWVKFSLHAGSYESYRRILCNSQNASFFERVQANIRRFVSKKTDNTKVSTGCVITQANQTNADILNYFQNAVHNLGVDYVLFRGYLGNDDNLKITRSPSELKVLDSEISKLVRQNGVYSNFHSFCRDYQEHRQYKEGFCPLVRAGLLGVITTDGNVHICLPLAQTKRIPAIGSILTDDFQSIWNSQTHTDVLNHLRIADCPACKYEKMFPLVKKIASQPHNQLLMEQVCAKMDPHWRFL